MRTAVILHCNLRSSEHAVCAENIEQLSLAACQEHETLVTVSYLFLKACSWLLEWLLPGLNSCLPFQSAKDIFLEIAQPRKISRAIAKDPSFLWWNIHSSIITDLKINAPPQARKSNICGTVQRCSKHGTIQCKGMKIAFNPRELISYMPAKCCGPPQNHVIFAHGRHVLSPTA